MKVSITNVHLDLGAGRRGTDMGSSAIHVAGLIPRLQAMGHEVIDSRQIATDSYEDSEVGDPTARFLGPIASTCRALADRVESNMEAGHVPLVLGGDHAQAMGTISGMARALRRRGERLGVLWIDAHTDMNTPSTSPSGNVHGMPLAALLGHGPSELVGLAGDEPALRPEDVALIGIRDVDPTESRLVEETGVRVYTMSELDERGTSTVHASEALDRVLANTAGVHLSFDLDGVDPAACTRASERRCPGGLTLRESHLICESDLHAPSRLRGHGDGGAQPHAGCAQQDGSARRVAHPECRVGQDHSVVV